MVDPDLVYASKFWPTPTDPPSVIVDLRVTEANGAFSFHAEVTTRDGAFRGVGGELTEKTRADAAHAAMYKLVSLLSEMLADATARNARG